METTAMTGAIADVVQQKAEIHRDWPINPRIDADRRRRTEHC